jgi:hypothetical protein
MSLCHVLKRCFRKVEIIGAAWVAEFKKNSHSAFYTLKIPNEPARRRPTPARDLG